MLKIMVVLAGLTVATAASAQLNPSPQNQAFSQSITQASQYPISGLRTGAPDEAGRSGRVCLREKATRRTVCHSRARWEAIAARIDAGRAPSQ